MVIISLQELSIFNLFLNLGLGLISIASIPTVTLPRIKSLISGSLPSFMDYFFNLNLFQQKQSLQKTENDDFVKRFRNKDKKIVFYGDDTWLQLFSPDYFHRINVTSSLFATDYTEVDSNVTYNVNRDLKTLNDFDVMILHYLGVDHIGHLRGFNSDLFPDKLHEMDNVFQNIFDTITFSGLNQTYLIAITGDHGMTNSGNHGGDTVGETHTALIFISTNKTHYKLAGSRWNEPVEKVLQIDFASTISGLFGLELPKKNQGRLISDVLDRFDVPHSEHLCLLFQNAAQIQSLLDNKKNGKFLNNNFKRYFIEALNNHWNFNQNLSIDYYNKAKKLYHEFIKNIQIEFVQQTTDRSLFSLLVVMILVSSLITLAMISIEFFYNRTPSILFSHLKNWSTNLSSSYSDFSPNSQSKCSPENMPLCIFSNLQYSSSSVSSIFILFIFLMKLFSIGSVRFMLNEHNFWYYLTTLMLFVKLFICVRYVDCILTKKIIKMNYFYRGYWNFKSVTCSEVQNYYIQLIINVLIELIIYKTLTYWKMPVLNDYDLTNASDISSWLNGNKRLLSSVVIFSLVVIASLVTNKTPSNRSHYILIASFIWTYLYR